MNNKYKDVTQDRSHINNQAFSILILDDDKVYQRILSFHLTELRYKVHVAGTIESFWHQLEAEKPDLLVIDMRLPDGTGFGVLHQVRETDKLIPIVVVSALDKPVERELAYNSGADVFLVKPVHINELMAVVKRFQSRVSAICAQMATAELAHSNPNETWRLLKTESLLISPNGKQLLLTTTEFAFLEFLALSEQEASRTTIAHYLKSVRLKDGHGYDGALNTMISRLRKRWSEVDASPLPIRAIRGTGYAFASHGEVHMDFGEHLGLGFGALTGELDAAALHVVAAALQDQHHVIGGAAPRACQHRFHGAWGHIGAAVLGLDSVGRAVHHQCMAAAGFGHKAHV
jgi:DNA-binding response OmpR family regulator